MKFGPASPMEALGGVTVHTLRQGSLVLKKGTTIGHAEVEALTRAGVKEIVVVRLEPGDVSEDVAAASIAQAVAGDGVYVERAFTGRANLFAGKAGVLVVDRAKVDRINGVDEAITFATLAAYKRAVLSWVPGLQEQWHGFRQDRIEGRARSWVSTLGFMVRLRSWAYCARSLTTSPA